MAKRLGIDINSSWAPAALIILLFWGANVFWAFSNIYQIATYRPVQVRVISKEIQRIRHEGRGKSVSYSYRPVITYSYTVDGQHYTSDRVTPLDEDGSETWARDILYRYVIEEETYTGYYNPLIPGDAFLIKRYDAGPYCMILPMSIVLLLVGAAALFTGSPAPVPDPLRQSDGWYLLGVQPTRDLPLPGWMIVAVVWFGLEVITVGPYFLLASPYDIWLTLGTTAYTVAGVALVRFFANEDIGQPLSTARVLADQDRFIRGDTLTLRVEALVLSPFFVKEMTLALISFDYERESHRKASAPPLPPLYEERVTLVTNYQARAGENLAGSHTFALPTDKSLNYWRVEVLVRDRSGAVYLTKVPVLMQNPPLSLRWGVGEAT